MKSAYSLLLCLFFSVLVAFAQQVPAANSPESNSATTPASKHSARKAKAPKKQSARFVDDDGAPMARSQHIKRLMRTIPGNDGELENGAAGAAEDAFQQRAFPDTDIPLDRILAARAAAATVNSRKFATGKGRPGTWVTVGPSQAIYPFSPFRTNAVYVPNKYDAASRTTSLAISPVCVPGNCTLWATPAGGGVWRTKNALDGEPNWTYVSSSFAINAVGSIVTDPNDPSGNTLWVGTGEANACGSGCEAGVGLYKSTDGACLRFGGQRT